LHDFHQQLFLHFACQQLSAQLTQKSLPMHFQNIFDLPGEF